MDRIQNSKKCITIEVILLMLFGLYGIVNQTDKCLWFITADEKVEN